MKDEVQGTAIAAINFSIEKIGDHYDRLEFLKAWRDGLTDSEWPEFRESPTPIAASSEAGTGAYEASNAKEEYLSELDERIEFFEGFAPAFAYGIIDPDYARIFTIARCIAWAEGYALAMHGSFTRDLDLIAVPWAAHACEPDHLARRIENAAALTISVAPKNDKPFGRLVWTMTLPTFADPRFVDLSVMPPAVAETDADAQRDDGLVSGVPSAPDHTTMEERGR